MKPDNRPEDTPIDPINEIPVRDHSVPEMDDKKLMLNDVRWNAWMDVLARCPICEENDVIKEIDKLNFEFKEIHPNK